MWTWRIPWVSLGRRLFPHHSNICSSTENIGNMINWPDWWPKHHVFDISPPISHWIPVTETMMMIFLMFLDGYQYGIEWSSIIFLNWRNVVKFLRICWSNEKKRRIDRSFARDLSATILDWGATDGLLDVSVETRSKTCGSVCMQYHSPSKTTVPMNIKSNGSRKRLAMCSHHRFRTTMSDLTITIHWCSRKRNSLRLSSIGWKSSKFDSRSINDSWRSFHTWIIYAPWLCSSRKILPCNCKR